MKIFIFGGKDKLFIKMEMRKWRMQCELLWVVGVRSLEFG